MLSVADMARLVPGAGADLALVDEGTKHVTTAREEVRSSMRKSATNLMLVIASVPCSNNMPASISIARYRARG